MENFVHSFTLENKTRISVTAVSEVTAFSDKEIKLKLKDNTLLAISGVNLKISCFDNKNATFLASGQVEGVRYRGVGENLVKKVFK